jgi:hypothetical protein
MVFVFEANRITDPAKGNPPIPILFGTAIVGLGLGCC